MKRHEILALTDIEKNCINLEFLENKLHNIY